ncbi:MAG: hypothetical protein AAGD01_04705 [Acidobacteriota bacterium]
MSGSPSHPAPPPPPANPPQAAWEPRPPQKKSKGPLWIILGVVGCFGLISFGGCFAAIFIPNFVDALQKAKQKRTVADMRMISEAYSMYLLDRAAPANIYQGDLSVSLDVEEGTNFVSPEEFSQMVSEYMTGDMPVADGWENPLEFYLADRVGDAPGLIIRSTGRDGIFESTVYPQGSYDPTEYDNDIVWTEGDFYYWPSGAIP